MIILHQLAHNIRKQAFRQWKKIHLFTTVYMTEGGMYPYTLCNLLCGLDQR